VLEGHWLQRQQLASQTRLFCPAGLHSAKALLGLLAGHASVMGPGCKSRLVMLAVVLRILNLRSVVPLPVWLVREVGRMLRERGRGVGA